MSKIETSTDSQTNIFNKHNDELQQTDPGTKVEG